MIETKNEFVFSENNIKWKEFQTNGIIRKLKPEKIGMKGGNKQ